MTTYITSLPRLIPWLLDLQIKAYNPYNYLQYSTSLSPVYLSHLSIARNVFLNHNLQPIHNCVHFLSLLPTNTPLAINHAL